MIRWLGQSKGSSIAAIATVSMIGGALFQPDLHAGQMNQTATHSSGYPPILLAQNSATPPGSTPASPRLGPAPSTPAPISQPSATPLPSQSTSVVGSEIQQALVPLARIVESSNSKTSDAIVVLTKSIEDPNSNLSASMASLRLAIEKPRSNSLGLIVSIVGLIVSVVGTGIAAWIAYHALNASKTQVALQEEQLDLQAQRSLLDSLRSQFETIWADQNVPINAASPSGDALEGLAKAAEVRGNSTLAKLARKWKDCEEKYLEMIDKRAKRQEQERR